MRIQPYERTITEPTSAGTVPMQGAGTAELGAAQGLSTLARATEELTVRAQEAQRVTDVMLRTTSFRQQYNQWFQQRSADASKWQTLDQDSTASLKLLSEQAVKDVQDPLARAAIQKDIIEFSATASIEAQKTKFSQQTDWSKGALQGYLYSARTDAARASNPVERKRLIEGATQMIRGASSAGFISPLDAEKQVKAFIDGTFEDQLQGMVYNDPDGVLRAIAAGQFDGLSEDVKQRTIVNAEKRAEAMRSAEQADARRRDRIEERQLQRNQDANFGVMYDAAKNGQLYTATAKQALESGNIRAEHFKQLWDTIEATQRAGGPGDPQVADQLRQDAYLGRLSMSHVLAATSDGPQGLNKNEVNELTDLVSKGSVFTQSANYKAAVSYLEGSLKTVGIAMSGVTGGGGQTDALAALAARELYVRVLSQGDKADPLTVAQEIAERFTQKMPLVIKPRPRYNSLQEASDAFRAGAISKLEFDSEVELFRRSKQGTQP